MPLFDDTLNELDRRRGQWPAISRATGISYSYLCKIGQRRIDNPGVRTIERLAAYFRAHPRAPPSAGAA